MSLDHIITLYSNGELSNNSKFHFSFFKENRKFLISVHYLNDNFTIKAAYEENICPAIVCKFENLNDTIENIDLNFKDKFRENIKIKGPLIYGGGHGTGFGVCSCCGSGVKDLFFRVNDINMPWSYDNKMPDNICYN